MRHATRTLLAVLVATVALNVAACGGGGDDGGSDGGGSADTDPGKLDSDDWKTVVTRCDEVVAHGYIKNTSGAELGFVVTVDFQYEGDSPPERITTPPVPHDFDVNWAANPDPGAKAKSCEVVSVERAPPGAQPSY
jgi:hypothetical protein